MNSANTNPDTLTPETIIPLIKKHIMSAANIHPDTAVLPEEVLLVYAAEVLSGLSDAHMPDADKRIAHALVMFLEDGTLANPEFMPVAIARLHDTVPEVAAKIMADAANYRIPGS